MALNFPTTGLYNGLTYTGDNGITYTYQDGKWVGSGVVSSTISDHLHHGSFNLTLNDDGTVQFPNYKFPVADGTNGQTLKTNGSGILTWSGDNIGGGGPSIGDMVFTGNTMNDLNGIIVQNYAVGHAATAAVILPVNGNTTSPLEINNTTGNVRIGTGTSIVNQWKFDTTGNLTLPTGGHVNYANGYSILEGIGGGGGVTSIVAGSGISINQGTGAVTITATGTPTNIGNYSFSGDNMVMPLTAKLNSGGVGVTNSAEFGTAVTKSGATVTHSEIYMGGGTAEARAITDGEGRSLMYLGVENVGEGKFAGIVAQDPNLDPSQYTTALNGDGLPILGDSTVTYATTVGVMNSDFTINGLYVDEIQTVVATGAHAWLFDNDGDFKVPQEIRNTRGARAVWNDEVPRDIADLTDNSMLLGAASSTLDINLDGGGAYATYEGTLVRADGGFSGTRWGVNTTIFDGGAGTGSSYTMTLNGGGA